MRVTPCRSKHGFSLLELSIVLTILGLLVGGVLTGQAVIRSSELRAIATEYASYSTAVDVFRSKYKTIPGDMSNATSIWGHSGGAGCANNSGAAVSSSGTCDGDGDGKIEYGANANESGEAFEGWRQLALAGLIEGAYSGLASVTVNGLFTPYAGGGAIDYVFGTNSPESKGGEVGWGLSYYDNSSNASTWPYANNYQNWFTIGGDDGFFADDPFLNASEAWSIDQKLDDGSPDSGSVQSLNVAGCSSVSGYNLSSDTRECALLFKQN